MNERNESKYMEKTLNEKEEQEFLLRTKEGLDIKFLFSSNGGRERVYDVYGHSRKLGQWRGIWRLDSLSFNKNTDELSYFARFKYDGNGCLEYIEIIKDYDIRNSTIHKYGYDFLNKESLEIIADKKKKEEGKNVHIPMYNIPTGYTFSRKLDHNTYLYDSLTISDAPWGYEKSGHFKFDPQENKFISTSNFNKVRTPPPIVIAQPNLSTFLIELNRIITLKFYDELEKQGYNVGNVRMDDINPEDIDLSELVSWFEEEKNFLQRWYGDKEEKAKDGLVSKKDIAKASKERKIPQTTIEKISKELKNIEQEKGKNNNEGVDRNDQF